MVTAALLRLRGRQLVADCDNLDMVADIDAKVRLIEPRIKPLVVAAKRVQDLPHHTIPLVIVERLFGRDTGRNADGQDDT
ncbi:hypothetical protein [Sphingopyxis sp.]|uniref:hypothetical protein n=1 Tax=Sphingopyxis sp. TaxID=1908224 RepID=UPI0025F9E900|nr:hypothetical protein [Sphingopyxis sp.]